MNQLDIRVEAAAKAWLQWQFGRDWDTAVPELQNKFREGAKVVLVAADRAATNTAELAAG